MAQDRVEAVERALGILGAFGDGAEGLALGDLAAKTGLYKSTILRICGSLEANGYLIRSDDGVFRLGPTLWRLGSLYRMTFDLGEHVRPVLRSLVEETGESASFYVRDGNHRICLYRQNSTHSLRHHIDEGAQLPLDRGASGRVLLAFSGENGAAFDAIRRDGYHVSLGERVSDVVAVSVPLLTTAGTLRGALAVSGPISRFDEDRRAHALDCLRTSARALGATLPAE